MPRESLTFVLATVRLVLASAPLDTMEAWEFPREDVWPRSRRTR
jgi:hypothetical protein